MSEERYKYIEFNGHKLEFYDKYEYLPNMYKEHVYLLDGFELPSVTQVLQEQDIAAEYPDTDAVKKAQERGTLIHAECEKVVLDPNYQPLITEALFVKNEVLPMLNNPKAEVLLCGENYAGQTDLIGDTLDSSAYIEIDYKTGNWAKDVVSYQETMYRYGLVHTGVWSPEKPVIHYVCQLRENYEDCKLIQIDPVPFEEHKKLCSCIGKPKTYVKPFFDLNVYNLQTEVENEAVDCFLSVLDRMPITVQYAIAKKMANAVKKIDDSIKQQLIDNNQERGKTPDGCTWELGERDDTRLDVKALQEEEPETYKKFCKTKKIKVLYFKGHPLFDKRRKPPKDDKELVYAEQ